MLVGCLRMHHLRDGMRCLTETIMGEHSFAKLLRGLRVERPNVVEFGRWMVHPSYRDGGRVGLWLAAAAGSITIRLAHGSAAKHSIVICSVGTADRQDLILRRIGLGTAPIKPIACERYSDHLQVMYCTDLQQLDDRFCVLMDEMAERLELPTQHVGEVAQRSPSTATATHLD
jgi:N-acyl-L-homoserine lactone synthetase